MVNTDQFERKVSLALHLRDDFSKEWGLVGSTRAYVAETGISGLEKAGGYQVFSDLTGPIITVRVENRYYFASELIIDLSNLDPRLPVVPLTMQPNYSYPFPSGSSLILGIVLDQNGLALGDVVITVEGTTVTNKSRSDGRFVLYFGQLTEDDITVSAAHRYITVGGNDVLKIIVEHPSYTTGTVTVGRVEEGSAKLLTMPVTLAS
jgi:hypothetical protein